MFNDKKLLAAGALALLSILAAPFMLGMMAMGLGNDGSGGSGGIGIVDATACAETIDQIDGLTLPYKEGKLGHEEHLTNTNPSHYEGGDSKPVTFAGGGAFNPHMTEQERWYITSQWVGFDWTPTRDGLAPIAVNTKLYAKNAHKKVIVTSKETGKSVVTSIEESGPALYVTDRDGVNFGAPPEVYKALGTSDPYTKNPNDNKGRIVVAFAKDQNIPLGICQAKASGKTVVLDPGHGNNGGAISGCFEGGAEGEYKINLTLALKTEEKLKAKGVNVILTRRTNDSKICNSERPEIANKAKASLFFSFHHDGADSASPNGAYFVMGPKSDNAAIYDESRKASSLMLPIIIKGTEFKEAKMGPIYERGLSVYSHSEVPFALLEAGFSSNARDKQLINDPAHQEKVATAVANAIISYLNSK